MSGESNRHLNKILQLLLGQTTYVKFCAPDDGRRNRLKHVERL